MFGFRKKGFTVVELAIVLLGTGLILTIALKGKSLIDSARYRAEISKVSKLEAVMLIFMAKNPDFVVYDTSSYLPWGGMDMDVFYDQGILAKNDLLSMVGAVSSRDRHTYWTPVVCKYHSGYIDFYDGTAFFAGTNFCARLLADVDATTSTATWVNMPPRVQCGIEIFLDDEDISTGSARRTRTFVYPNFTDEEYKNCISLSIEEPTDKDMGFVIY